MEAVEGSAVCMEGYPHLTTQAGEQVSPAWLCCMGRSSAAPEALHAPLTVSVVGSRALDSLFSVTTLCE